MKSYEHRAVGQAAGGGVLVNIGGERAEERCVLSYGDVVALSGDYFPAEELFRLAAIPGDRGTRPGTRDEIICALKVMAVDEGYVDARFEPTAEFGHCQFTATAAVTQVERLVRNRYLMLATTNGDHFVAPDPSDSAQRYKIGQSSRFGSAVIAYRRLHEVALEEAFRLGRCRGDESRAMAREAAAQHYLTDAFASGHLRTPVTAIRRFWNHRYPRFWQNLQHKIAADTASALRELTRPVRILPGGFVYDRALAAVKARTSGYPPITVGDLMARVFHDWDCSHGLILEGGGTLFGDGHLEEGVGKELAVAATRAGITDIEVAYRLGASGSRLRGESLYRAVRVVTGAPEHIFEPETRIPIPSADNPPQNWRATNAETLWNSPIVGTADMTIGMAIEEMLRPGTELSRRLDWPGASAVKGLDLPCMPAWRRWATRKTCQAYQHGFMQGLAQDPAATVLAIIDGVRDQPAGDEPPGLLKMAARRSRLCRSG